MSDDPANALFADEETRHRRPGIATLVIALGALAVGLYAVLSARSVDSRLDEVAAQAERLAAAQGSLANELSSLANREAQATADARRQIESLLSLSRDVAALENTTAELQDRSAVPQRSWARAEALALLELAQRQLRVERNVDAALEAMVTADGRLAQLREPAFSTVRRQLLVEIETLRGFPRPDLAAITAGLRSAEAAAGTLPTAGILVGENEPRVARDTDEGVFARALRLARETLGSLVTVRSGVSASGSLVTAQEQRLTRQRMQLHLLEARLAIAREDPAAFAAAIGEARAWLGERFVADDAGVAGIAATLDGLVHVDIAPPLPDISSSLRLLREMVPLTRSGA